MENFFFCAVPWIWKCCYNCLLPSPPLVVIKTVIVFCYGTYFHFSFPSQSLFCCFWEIKCQSVKVSVSWFLPLKNIPYGSNDNLLLATVSVLWFSGVFREYQMRILVRNELICLFLLPRNKIPIIFGHNRSPPSFQEIKYHLTLYICN